MVHATTLPTDHVFDLASDSGTLSCRAFVVDRAADVVIAVRGIIGVYTADVRGTRIISTDLGIITIRCRSRDTLAILAGVVFSTLAAVLAGQDVVGMHTAGVGDAGIVGADVVIVAVD